MKSALQFVLFQGLWFAAVLGAARGQPWLGALALVPYLAAHGFVLGVPLGGLLRAGALGLAGAALDSGFTALGLLSHQGMPPGWPPWLAPPWIAALWIAFALLPTHSLAWLAPHPRLALLAGALGGPLSALAGERAGALDLGEPRALVLALLALEYAAATVLLLRCRARLSGARP